MLHRSLRSRRGSTASTVALTMPVLLGAVAMGVDWGQVSVARFQVQAAADEAALAAASAYNDRPSTTSKIAAAKIIALDRASSYSKQIQVNSQIPEVMTLTPGYYDDGVWSLTYPAGKGPNAVEVVTKTKVSMSFTRMFGINEVTVTAKAKAAAGIVPIRAPDLVIAQDVTPSMDSVDIAASKAANAELINCIETRASSDTRGAFVKFASIDKTMRTLVSYDAAPGSLYTVSTAASSYSSADVCLGSGGCTSHSSGMYAGVSILNAASAPPPGVGQAIIFITDGAPYTGGGNCTSAVMGTTGGTPYQVWLRSQCTAINAISVQATCENAGGRWNSGSTPKCRAADNGSEGTTAMGVGKCSTGGWSTEARCAGNGGVWQQKLSATANPSLLTKWTTATKDLAGLGTHDPIDVYAVFYSAGHTADAYHNDNIAFLEDNVVRGKGADLGVQDAPTSAALTAALIDVCKSYTEGGVGLIE